MNIEGIEYYMIGAEKQRDVMVSVCCVVYNHEKYIRDCLNGILMQKVDFEYEIVILDDQSTDGTREILEEYQKRYPQKVFVFQPVENIYTNKKKPSFLPKFNEKHFKGKYVAYCEGDDYWIDDKKLQKQIDFLEQNPDYSMTMHNAYQRNVADGSECLMKNDTMSHELSAEDIILLKGGMWPTASIVGKKEICLLNHELLEFGIGDWPMQLWAKYIGKCYYFKDIMGVYRYMVPGSWSEKTHCNMKHEACHMIDTIELLVKYNKITEGKYRNLVLKKIYKKIGAQAKLFEKNYEVFFDILDYMEKDEMYSKYVSLLKKLQQIYKGKYTCSNKRKDCYDKYNNKKVFVIPASKSGFYMKHMLEKKGVIVNAFLDNDDSKIGELIEEAEVISFKLLKEKFLKDDCIIQVASGQFDTEMCQQIEQMGYPYSSAIDFFCDFFNCEEVSRLVKE